MHVTDARALLTAAGLAADHDFSVFDAIFVARAIERGLPLLTSDARLVRAVENLLPTELLRGVDGR